MSTAVELAHIYSDNSIYQNNGMKELSLTQSSELSLGLCTCFTVLPKCKRMQVTESGSVVSLTYDCLDEASSYKVRVTWRVDLRP